MKILHIVKTNEGANWAFNQAKWLNDYGLEIITVLPEIDGGMAEKYKENGMRLEKGDFSLPLSKPWEIIKRSKSIRELVEKTQPDLIHSHFVTNIMMLRIALRNVNIPRLFQVPGPLHLENELYRKAEIILSNSNDYWAGACKKTCDIYSESGIAKDRIFLAYYGGYGGASCDEYEESTNILHDEYNIPSDRILVGMVSYFYKPKVHMLQFRGLKGHEDFIDAILIARKLEPRILGVIIGDAWGTSSKYVQKIKKYAQKECGENIIFTGFRKDMKRVYKELDIAVHPSHSENLGGAAESLAAGVPTISTNVGGFPDIIIDGETGYAVNAKSPKELADAIIKMIYSKKKSTDMAFLGQKLVREMLDIEHTSKSILKYYNNILESINGVKSYV